MYLRNPFETGYLANQYVRTNEKRKNVWWWTEHDYYYLKVDRDSIGSHEKYIIEFNV